jgi:hypothetical protein
MEIDALHCLPEKKVSPSSDKEKDAHGPEKIKP